MAVSAKFRVTTLGIGSVNLSAVNSKSGENEQFFKGTPVGIIQMSTLTDETLKHFESGKEYTVTFSPVE